jgi:hypothetical protein
MIIFAHIAFAEAVSSAGHFSWPAAFLFGLFSHHLLDLIPHTDASYFWSKKQRNMGIMPQSAKIIILIDILLSLGFLIWAGLLLKIRLVLLFWASLGAVLPDFIITGFPFFIPKMRNWRLIDQYVKWHHTILEHLEIPENWILGVVSTILIIGISFVILLR